MTKPASTAAVAVFCLLTAAEAHAGCTVSKFLELPVTMQSMQPIATVTINGKNARMMLDTGAFYSVLYPDTVKQLALPQHNIPGGFNLGGVGGAESAGEATVQDFGIGKTMLHRVEFLVAGGSIAGDTYSGILAQNFLRTGDAEFDLANGVVRLFQSKDCDGANLAYWASPQSVGVLSINDTDVLHPHIMTTATINGVKMRVLIDSGASLSILSASAAARAGITSKDPDATPGGELLGFGHKRTETWIVPVKSFELDQEETRNTRLRIGDLGQLEMETDVLLGADFLLSHRVYISYRMRKIYFTYNGGPVFNLIVHRAADDAASATAPEAAAAASSAPASNYSDTPVDAAGFDRRGAAFASRNELDQAIPDFTRAIQLDPNNPDYPYHRAEALLRNRQSVLAMSDLDQAIRLKPDLVPALLARGELRLSAHDTNGAQADFTAALAAAPQDEVLPLREADSYGLTGQFSAANELYTRWIDSHPRDEHLPDALIGRCQVRGFLGLQLDEALADCNAALKQGTRNANALTIRAMVYLRLGEYAPALADADAALKLQPKDAIALYCRGLARRATQPGPQADADLQAALALTPDIKKRFENTGLEPRTSP